MAAREKLLSACTARYPESTTLALDFAYIKAAVAMIREMRKDLMVWCELKMSRLISLSVQGY
jgi:hypothetical protein